MKSRFFLLTLVGLAIAIIVAILPILGPSNDALILANQTPYSGGEKATVFEIKQTAFAQPIKNLDGKRRRVFTGGDHLFNTQWVEAPASVTTLDGVGPLLNRNSCSACHLRDGRGRPPIEGEEQLKSKLLRLSVPGNDETGGPLPHPVYGGQLQERSILGVPAEGKTKITWTEETGTYKDGSTFQRRHPKYEITELAYGDLGEDTLFSPRVAPAVFGLGLLGNIPEEQILANSDPEDKDGDGISGRPNYVWNRLTQGKSLGRLGWKANQPNLIQQNAGAFNGDMGLTTTLFPDPSCTSAQTQCIEETQYGEQPEVSDKFLKKVTTYLQLLAVPARRNLEDTEVLQGERLFYEANCNRCHFPQFTTGKNTEHPELNEQVIHPYSDLLLHDMGSDLADQRPDFDASGQEWRTPPLWGVGLVKNVNKHTFFLHDGRARNLTEAVLWHGGEAAKSQKAFTEFSKSDRDALITFLESL